MAHVCVEEGQLITCTCQTNYNSLVHSLPWLLITKLIYEPKDYLLIAELPLPT